MTEPKKIGRYQILDRIAEGGAAEVYRGLLDTGIGPHRIVAIKRIHDERADDATFLEFMREETQLCKALCHPNVVQTLDCGEESGKPFIVLEYVNGRSLKQVLERLADLGRPIPVELAAFIGEQSASALHYGHVFTDPGTGKTLNIIHRDVSPQNILVSYAGIPKLIDFGIAKVLQNGDKTRSGLIKGKPAYLSPEQALGKAVDARSDLFALGIVLWEALTGRSLFGGLERMACLRAITDQSVVIAAPSMINPSVSPALDAIVLKALQRDPEKRFRSAHEMQVQLYQSLTNRNREHCFRELSALLQRIFPEEIKKEREELEKLGAVIQQLTGSSVSDPSWLIPAIMPAVSRGGLGGPASQQLPAQPTPAQPTIPPPPPVSARPAGWESPRMVRVVRKASTAVREASQGARLAKSAGYVALGLAAFAGLYLAARKPEPPAMPPPEPIPVTLVAPEVAPAPVRAPASKPHQHKRNQKARKSQRAAKSRRAPSAR
jgi:eukaryotic-like serine/threonine-protein kinase